MKITATKSGNAAESIRSIAAMLKRPQPMLKEVGRAVANQIRKHLTGQNNKGNKLGGTTTGFYDQVRQATGNPEMDGQGVSITIADLRFPLQVYGGTVTPKKSKWLTIPLHALAHGRRASVFEDETGTKLFRPKGTNVLMASFGQEAVPIYALAKSATIKKNPDALPTDDSMEATAVEQAQKHYARQLASGGVIGQVS